MTCLVTGTEDSDVASLGYWIVGTNGHGKDHRVWQPNLKAARVTHGRLIGEGLNNVEIRRRELGD